MEAVRKATPDDTAAVAVLEAESRLALVGQRGAVRFEATTPPIGDAWAERLESDGVHVATFDGVPVGFIEVDRAGDVAAIRQVFVHPDAREIGFGDWLVEAAVAEARAAGCAWIEGTALPGDRATKNLYERAGITARLIVVSAPLV